MKYLGVLLITLAAFAVKAQSSKREQVVAAVEQFRQQMINPNKVVLNKLLHTDLSYGHSSGVLETKQQVMEILLGGSSDYTLVEFQEPSYSVQKNTATVRCNFVASLLDKSKKPVNLNLKVVMVLVKNKYGWQILLRQGFRPPVGS